MVTTTVYTYGYAGPRLQPLLRYAAAGVLGDAKCLDLKALGRREGQMGSIHILLVETLLFVLYCMTMRTKGAQEC